MRQTENAKRSTESDLGERLRSAFSLSPRRSRGGQTVVEAGQEQILPSKRRTVVRKIIYAVVSLILATIIWGYVLMTQNPDREKTFTDITPSFESGAEADLVARKLSICDVAEVLKQVSVTVSAPLTEVSKITEKNITATISMNEVHAVGTYSLEIRATSTMGTVVSVEPDHVEVTIEDVMSRTVPINYSFVGEMPEGYWHDEPTLSPSTVTLEGARSDIEKVSGAVCYIDLGDATSSISRSMPLTVIDGAGSELDGANFKNVIPAVTVTMAVLPHKLVDIEYEIIDRDMLSDFYEVKSETLSVTSLDIAAEPEVLESLDKIVMQPVSIGGLDEPKEYFFTLIPTNIPSSARLINGSEKVSLLLTVSIVDVIVTESFKDVPITFLNESPLFHYEYEFDKVDMTVTGPARVMLGFVSSDVVVCVNLQQRGVGQYDFVLEFKPIDMESFGEIEIALSKTSVHVVVTTA